MTAACHAAGKSASPQVVRGEDSLTGRRAALLGLIGPPACEATAECRTAPLGAKPCGGPGQYVIYSTRTTDSARLATALTTYNALAAADVAARGLVSDCRVVTPPAVACVESRCTTASRRR